MCLQCLYINDYMHFNSLIIFVLIFIFASLTTATHCSYNDDNNPLKIKSLLPKDYIAISPPFKSHPVYIGLEIIDVDSINDAENYFSLQLYLFEVWSDIRLNTSQLLDEESISVPEVYTTCLWTPSLVFDGSTQMEQILSPKTVIKIVQNKLIVRKSRYSFKVRCHMNLQTYPMDIQNCHFKIRTFSESTSKVDLHWFSDESSPKHNLFDSKENKSVIYGKEFTPSLFDIKVGQNVKYNLLWLKENYTMLDVEFIFERRITASILTVYIPSSLIVTLSWLQFWFDVEAVPGRMSLGIMSTLTIMTQILTNYEKAANHVTAVDIWLFVCLIMVFLALMEYSFAYTLSHYYNTGGKLRAKNSIKTNLGLIFRSSEKKVNPSLNETKSFNPEKSQNSVNLKDSTEVQIKTLTELCELLQNLIKSFNELQDKLDPSCKCNRHLNQVDYISRYIFPIAFVLFVIIYWFALIYYSVSSLKEL